MGRGLNRGAVDHASVVKTFSEAGVRIAKAPVVSDARYQGFIIGHGAVNENHLTHAAFGRRRGDRCRMAIFGWRYGFLAIRERSLILLVLALAAGSAVLLRVRLLTISRLQLVGNGFPLHQRLVSTIDSFFICADIFTQCDWLLSLSVGITAVAQCKVKNVLLYIANIGSVTILPHRA